MTTQSKHKWLTPHNYLSLQLWETIGSGLFNLFIFFMIFVYLFPMLFMVATSLMEGPQLSDRNAPAYPAKHIRTEYQGKSYAIYNVPFPNGETRQLALVEPGRTSSQFVDPKTPEDGLISWDGNWRQLKGVYRFYVTLDNFSNLFSALRIPQMVRNTLIMTMIGEFGVLLSSIVVAYGFSRFPLPGGDFLFYILIATILIPEKVTLIPTYFFFVRILALGRNMASDPGPILFWECSLYFPPAPKFQKHPQRSG